MNTILKPAEQIAALSASAKYQNLDKGLRAHLLTQVQGASDELGVMLPGLLSRCGSALESEFLHDLVDRSPARTAPSQPQTETATVGQPHVVMAPVTMAKAAEPADEEAAH